MDIENQEQELGNQDFDETQDQDQEDMEQEEEQGEEEQFDDEAEAEQDDEQEDDEQDKNFRDLRKAHRQALKREREKDKKIAELEGGNAEKPTLEQKPDIEDFDHDIRAYDEAMAKWYSKKSQIEATENQVEQKKQQYIQKYNTKLEAYKEKSTTIENFKEAESVVVDLFDVKKQEALLMLSKNPTSLVHALGRDEDMAEELAKIDNDAEFIYALGKYEAKLSTNKTKKPAVQAERRVPSAKGTSINSYQKQLDKLELEAEKTGDRSKIQEFRKKYRDKLTN